MSEATPATVEPVTIKAPEARLSGRLFRPETAPDRTVILHPATGVPQRFYARFAQWLATEHNAAVLTYDYRDSGESAHRPIKDATASMSDWGVLDQSAALDWLVGHYPELPVWVVGHSLGGMCVPFHARADRVERIVAVASGKAHFTRHPPIYIPAVMLFWFALGPLLTALFGYLPAKYSGIGADLPANAFWQWRRWCTSRKFHEVDWGNAMPVPNLTRVTADLSLIAISDDFMMAKESVWRLKDLYPAATVVSRVITPESAGLKRIGHLHIFSERCKAAWPLLIERSDSTMQHAA